MAGNFDELLKKAEAEKREKAGLPPLEEEPEQPTAQPIEETEQQPETISAEAKHAAPKHKKKGNGIVRGIVTFVIVLGICCALAYTIVISALDFSGLNKSEAKVEIVVKQGSSTEAIASVLEENQLIDHPLIFRLYSKFTKRDGKYQAGIYSVSANMGYQTLTDTIIAGNPRETVSVTIPEGFTVDQIAAKLAENGVCTTADFYDALLHETYDFDFFASIPKAEDAERYNGRIYRLEGYLFPDTYEFYKDSSGKSVIQKFLSNFNQKFTTEMKSAMQAQNLTLDDVVIMASIAQMEAANDGELPKVTKVLYNRLASDYTRLECDSTALYTKDLMPNIAGAEIINKAYDTYERSGLTAGAICNPGLAALQAAVFPSDDSYIAQCYYFANDSKGNTYYSKTFAAHEAVCRKYGIGMYG